MMYVHETSRTFAKIMALAAFCAFSACGSLGERIDIADTQGSQPKISTILGDLQANGVALRSFEGGGAMLLESPHFAGKRTFTSKVFFRKPGELFVQGRHRATGILVFRMLCVDEEFVMDFPKKKGESFYQVEGEEFEDVPFSVSPSDIAQEMFLPENWEGLKRRECRLVGWNTDSGTATMEIGSKDSPRRRIEVALTESDSPRWVIVSNELLNEKNGNRIALTSLEDYTQNEDILFPSVIDATYPTEDTRMKMTFRKIEVNAEVEEEFFDIQAWVERLGLVKR